MFRLEEEGGKREWRGIASERKPNGRRGIFAHGVCPRVLNFKHILIKY